MTRLLNTVSATFSMPFADDAAEVIHELFSPVQRRWSLTLTEAEWPESCEVGRTLSLHFGDHILGGIVVECDKGRLVVEERI